MGCFVTTWCELVRTGLAYRAAGIGWTMFELEDNECSFVVGVSPQWDVVVLLLVNAVTKLAVL